MTEENKISRALAGDVAKQLIDEMKRKSLKDFNIDRSVLTISDWGTEELYRDMAIMDPTLPDDPIFQHLWRQFREEQVTKYIRENKDSVAAMALLHEPGVSENVFNSIYFWGWLKDKGADNQGDLIEILGPMRSGKTNFMVWLMRQAVHQRFYVISNIPLKNPLKNYIQIHSLTELLLNMAKFRKEDPECVTCIFLDEQAGIKGSGARTATTRESRWSDNFIRLIGKFGASLWRARQFDDVIKEQKGLVTIEFEKSRDKLSEAHGTIKQGENKGTDILMKPIPDLHDEYDTRSLSSFTVDIDMEDFNKRYAAEENRISESFTMEDAVMKIIDDMSQPEPQKQPTQQNKSRERVIELYRKGNLIADISALTGYSPSQIHRIINEST